MLYLEKMSIRAIAMLAICLSAACSKDQKDGESTLPTPTGKVQIVITPSSASIGMGETVQLTATVTPDDPDNERTINWSSSSESIATVNNDGLVTGRNPGTAVIIARCGSTSKICTVTVTLGSYAGVFSSSSDPRYAWSLGGRDNVNVYSNASWTLSCDAQWLTISPSSGKGSNSNIVVSTAPNDQDTDRTAVIRFQSEEGSKELTVTQHGNIFRYTFLKRRKLSHAFRIDYTSVVNLTKLIAILPYAETDQYQTISESEYGDAQLSTSPEGVKYLYFWATGAAGLPQSGSNVLKHDFTVDFQLLETDFSKITQRDIKYDTDQKWYKRYTGKSIDADGSMMIDPTHTWIVTNANSLWEESNGDVIEYARLCYEFVASSFTYGIYSGDNSVSAIIERMSGDCGNQHAIWLSLMRAKGVPARPIVMYSPDNFTHVRGEFCVAGYGWIPVDVTYHQGGGDYFGRFTDDNLVVMNHEFAFDATIRNDHFHIGLLQVVAWWYWCSGAVNIDGDTSLKYAQ